MIKEYKVAPLPFIGQKRMFAAKYKQVLKDIEGVNVVVDLFGGSGLLSLDTIATLAAVLGLDIVLQSNE